MSSSVQQGDLTQYKESLLKKRKKDDFEKNRRIDARAKQKMDQTRQKKIAERLAAGAGTIMPEVFVSNHMKQQRNFVHYKRQKAKIVMSERLQKEFEGKNTLFHQATESQKDHVKEDSLLVAIRIKGKNESSTP